MHLLAAQPGGIDDGAEAVDLQQTPGDIVILSAADSELALLAGARADLGEAFPSVRLANVLQLGHPLSVDLYVEQVVARAEIVIVRLLGGVPYWRYGIEQVVEACRRHDTALALLPGGDAPDPELEGLSRLPAEARGRLWAYARHGGADNAREWLCYAASLIGRESEWREPVPLPRAGLYWPGLARPSLADLQARWRACRPNGEAVGALLFYRALVQAADLAPIDAMIDALLQRGLRPLPLFVASLKDAQSLDILAAVFAQAAPQVLLNATSFAASIPGEAFRDGVLARQDCPVLQVVLSSGTEAAWRDGAQGLSARDLAMNVALPEVDGRVLTRAISFKSAAEDDARTQTQLVRHRPLPDRIGFVAELARAWCGLRRTPAADRRIAIVLANYPNRDGRIANGVGLDTPAGVIEVLRRLQRDGYALGEVPADGNALIAGVQRLRAGEHLPLAAYREHFDRLPQATRAAVVERWGPPEADPRFDAERGFEVAVWRCGAIAVAIQPTRGYDIDPLASYHDPDLPPPHNYFAFYIWLRESFGAQAVVHMGKHGNLEWLPGKALALSDGCFPEAAFGPLPHLYPFIVNDPGEGSQAKRRAQAVIVDHLTPPLTRADSYGPLRDLELLVDEYYEAAGLDRRRLPVLRGRILELSQANGLDIDCGMNDVDADDARLKKLDAYLCELKEMQIRDGLHVFGRAPAGAQRRDLLLALARVPRGGGAGRDASLLRALAGDLGFDGFDPLDTDLAAAWTGPRPAALANGAVWRSAGDTVERLESLARDLLDGRCADTAWTRTRSVLEEIEKRFAPALDTSGEAELDGLAAGLAGRFVAPGPSGAPSRGRPEVLPTGRNFYAVDTRAVPTPAAWHLGWKAAGLVLETYRQQHGAWPRTLALSAWGTANMRTGGDDIAQALALIGARPTWDGGAGRVSGFEILPPSVLDRPRIDVTLRVSGFFRDAFPTQIALFDSAVQAIADLDESESDNPLAAAVRADCDRLRADGLDPAAARRQAGFRVFGSKPGAYGAGMQALIDEGGWREDADFAAAYIAWGGYAYGARDGGTAAHDTFTHRLGQIGLVVHNQDNREHDILDSDDYYQFEGGLAAAVRVHAGAQPMILHGDHSRPDALRVRRLEDEIGRIVRARAANPKWLAGVMRHGYKGAFEIAATVDYLFAFAATARVVRDHHFDILFDAYLGDDRVRGFIAENNPAALVEIADRFLEAQDRGLWQPRRNRARAELEALAQRKDPA